MTPPVSEGEGPLRMDAYYYGFRATGVRAVDEILSAVATAGKMYHRTEAWNDETEWAPVSPAMMIQSAANRAAESFRRAAPSLDAQAVVDVDALTVAAEIADETFRPTLAKRLRAMLTASTAPPLDAHATSVMQDDMAELLRVLGLGDHARDRSPHEVMTKEIIPAVRAAVAPLDAQALAEELTQEVARQEEQGRAPDEMGLAFRAIIERAGRRG